MKLTSIALSAALLSFTLAPTQIMAHHSNVAYEVTKVLTITGVVKEFKWSNPHTWIGIIVDDGKGNKVEWAMEGRAPGVLSRAGWSKASVQAGDSVTIDYSPSKDGSRTGIIARVTKADGSILANAPPGD